MRMETALPHTGFDRVFHALSDPTRLRLAALLAATRDRACVCELSDALDERVYNVSRHLNALADAGLLRSAREGRWVYYRFAAQGGPAGKHLTALLTRLVDARAPFVRDRRRLEARLALREDGRCVIWKVDPGRLHRRARPRRRLLRNQTREPRKAVRG